MNYKIRLSSAVFLCITCLFLLVSCAHNQYEKVAKEWCTAIRANQMIPVYPLNQDVRPGEKGDIHEIMTFDLFKNELKKGAAKITAPFFFN